MKLVNEDIKNQAKAIVFSGNGVYPELELMSALCNKYNGANKFIFYPRTILKKQTGLNALNAIKYLCKFYRFIIFLIDGEHINLNNPLEDFIKYLKSIGIEIIDSKILLEKKTFLIRCKRGVEEFSLYCIILGSIFVEEQIVKLIKLRDKNFLQKNIEKINKKRIKKEIRVFLKNKNLTLRDILIKTSKENIESLFQNICIVLKRIEEI
ncbi:MAG: hypothetical protein ACP6IY_21805 [Promethearchaeia archaeon]